MVNPIMFEIIDINQAIITPPTVSMYGSLIEYFPL